MNDNPNMTEELAAKALTLVSQIGLKQHQAAAFLGINQGRVSEVISGKRFAHVKPWPKGDLQLDI